MAKSMTLTFPVSPGDTIYKLQYKPCHLGETYPDSYWCCGCIDECDIEKTITEFCVPNVDWILSNYRDLDISVWFTSKDKAEKAMVERKI